MLKVLKVVLSVVALLSIAISAAMTEGLFNVAPTLIAVIMAGAALFGYFGISPLALSAAVSKVLGGVFMFMTALVGWHASVVTAATNPHPHIWHAVGAVAIIVGVLSRGPLNPSPPQVAPAAPKP